MNGQRDSIFLNEVLKRLGQAGDDNLRLQKERDVLQQEVRCASNPFERMNLTGLFGKRDELQKRLDEFSCPAPKQRVPLNHEAEAARTVDFSKLSELEEGIKGAQESYQKIEAKVRLPITA